MTKPLPYPPGDAEGIAGARLQGMKPADTVLVCLCDKQDCTNPQVFPEIGASYRWDFIKGLRVIVLKNKIHDVAELLHDIERSGPSQLDLIDVETQQGCLILFTKPLKTVVWPVNWVRDWLSSGDWHRELQKAKDVACHQAAIQKKLQSKEVPEAVWN
ncbi:hypothetical protein [Rhodoferax sp. GW822-FHT02A01]|uniref:hypothetical protein n=1 Tax=Rhodoferax sp. GW822-FHT02A01 TaxID=3141537 RepID=UPI00315C9E8E